MTRTVLRSWVLHGIYSEDNSYCRKVLNSFGLPGVGSDVWFVIFKLFMYSRFSISMGSTSVDSTNHQLDIFEKNSRNFQKADPEFATHRHLFTQRWHCIRCHKLKYMWVCAGCVQILCHFIWKTWASVDFGVSLSWRCRDQSPHGCWGATVCCRFK